MSEHRQPPLRRHLGRLTRNTLIFSVLVLGLGVLLLTLSPSRDFWLLFAGVVAVGLVLGIVTCLGIIWPKWNLSLRQLSAYGEPEQIIKDIDAELERQGEVWTFGTTVKAFRISSTTEAPILLTPSWMVQLGALRMNLVRLDDATWIYKKIVDVNSMRTFSVVVHRHGGRPIAFGQSETEIDKLLQMLAAFLPKVRVGYP